MSTAANNVMMTVTGAPGAGTATLNVASANMVTFLAAYGAVSTTVDVRFQDGTAWEIARNCTYNGGSPGTVTRGTLENSSTGTALTLTSATTVEVVLPASTINALDKQLNRGLVSVASNSSTTQTTGSGTQVQIDAPLTTVLEDPFSWWNTSTKRFIPQRVGSYLVFVGVQFNGSATGRIQAFIKKNGSSNVATGELGAGGSFSTCTCSGVVSLNGSSDYLTLDVYTDNAITTNVGSTAPYFQAIFLG